MILLDTHVWIWWVHGDPRLSPAQIQAIDEYASAGLGISIISCWEVAKLVEYGRLSLPLEVGNWFQQALSYPGIELFELTPRIVVESTQLPRPFHKDPADQLIVATSRVHGFPLWTVDDQILRYPEVETPPIGG